jgi:hypothetical protein
MGVESHVEGRPGYATVVTPAGGATGGSLPILSPNETPLQGGGELVAPVPGSLHPGDAAPPLQGWLFGNPSLRTCHLDLGNPHFTSQSRGNGEPEGDSPGTGGRGSRNLLVNNQRNSAALTRLNGCKGAKWVRVRCEKHGNVRYVRVRCKRRDCEYCGPLGRWALAERISQGVRHYQTSGAWVAWLVLTFAQDVDKRTAVRRLGRFVRVLRARIGHFEYAATYELTERGRLHVNLVLGPWKWVDSAVLRSMWRARLSVAAVQDDKKIGREVAASYSPESLGGYLCKLEQSVPRGWGRRVSFSRGWPGRRVVRERLDGLTWSPVGDAARAVIEWGWLTGKVVAVGARVFAWTTQISGGPCTCFTCLERPDGETVGSGVGKDRGPP